MILGSNPESGVISGLILEEVSSLVLSGAAAPPAKLGSYFMLAGNVLQLWHPLKESLEKTLGEIRTRLGTALGEPGRAIAPAHFGDIVAEALLFPDGGDHAARRRNENSQPCSEFLRGNVGASAAQISRRYAAD